MNQGREVVECETSLYHTSQYESSEHEEQKTDFSNSDKMLNRIRSFLRVVLRQNRLGNPSRHLPPTHQRRPPRQTE